MYNWLKDLFPINRSLSGDGNRFTLNYFKKINPEFKNIKFKSGTNVFDWIIPLEWNVKDAYLQNIKTKKKYCEFKKNNLHLVGYSHPLKKIMNLNELKNKIFTDKNDNTAIPYVTSYYKRDWGFCLSKKQKKNCPKENIKFLLILH